MWTGWRFCRNKLTKYGVTCFANDQVTVQVRIPSKAITTGPGFPIADSFEVCINETPLLGNIPINGTGHWEDVYGGYGTITNVTSNNTTVNPLFPCKSKWAWVIETEGGCWDADTITVINNTVTSDADLILSGEPNITIICEDNYTLNATDPMTFFCANDEFVPYGNWTSSPITVTINDVTAYNTFVSGLSTIQTNILNWTITKGGCSATSQLNIDNVSIYADAGENQEICEDTTTLIANDPSLQGATGYWSLIAGMGDISNITLYNTEVTNLIHGTTVLEWTVINGECSDSDYVIIENGSIDVNTGSDHNICSNSITLEGSENGTWEIIDGTGYIVNSTLYPMVVYLGSGANTLRWTVTNGNCSDWNDIIITNHAPSSPVTEDDKEVCVDYTTLSANEPLVGTGIWTNIDCNTETIINPTAWDGSAYVINLCPGINTFVWTTINLDCELTDTLVITNNHVEANAGINDTVCETHTNLEAVDPTIFYPNFGTGTWTQCGGSGIVTTPSATNTEVTNLITPFNQFCWTVTEGNCSAEDQVIIMNYRVEAIVTKNLFNLCDDDFPILLPGVAPVTNDGFWTNIGGLGTVETNSLHNSHYYGLNPGESNTLTWTVSQGVCSDVETVIINNNSFASSAGIDQNTCIDSTQLNAYPVGGVWSVDAGSANIYFEDSTDPQSWVYNLGLGTTVLIWTVNQDGCNASTTVSINNNSPSQAIITGPLTTETCDGEVDLTALIPETYIGTVRYWSQLNGCGTYDASSISNFTLNVTELCPGKNQFKWTIENGVCSVWDTITIVNNEVASYPGTDTNICENNTYLNATSPGNVYTFQGVGVWTNLSSSQDKIVNSTDPQTQVIDLSPGTTTFQWAVTLGSCEAINTIQINNIEIEAIATDLIECDGDFILNGNDPSTFGATGEWVNYGVGNLQLPTSLYNTTIIDVPYGSTTTLTWTVSKGVCSDVAVITVENNGFELSAGNDIIVCSFDDVRSLNATDPAPNTGTWKHISGPGVVIANSLLYNSNIYNIQPGINLLTWTVSNGTCSDEDTIIVHNTYFTVSAGEDRVVCDTQTVLDATPPGIDGTGSWSISTGGASFENETLFNTNVFGLKQGINTLQWTVIKNGCSDYATVVITNGLPIANAGGNDLSCLDSFRLNAVEPAAGTGTGTWSLTRRMDNYGGNRNF